MTFQQDDLFKRDNSFGVAAVSLKLMAALLESTTGTQLFNILSKFSFQPK